MSYGFDAVLWDGTERCYNNIIKGFNNKYKLLAKPFGAEEIILEKVCDKLLIEYNLFNDTPINEWETRQTFIKKDQYIEISRNDKYAGYISFLEEEYVLEGSENGTTFIYSEKEFADHYIYNNPEADKEQISQVLILKRKIKEQEEEIKELKLIKNVVKELKNER